LYKLFNFSQGCYERQEYAASQVKIYNFEIEFLKEPRRVGIFMALGVSPM